MTASISLSMVVLARTCSVQLTGKEYKKISPIEITVSLVRVGSGIDDTELRAEVN